MKKVLIILWLIFPINSFAVEWCATPDSGAELPGLPTVDTVRAIAIYAVGAGYPVQRVPTWYRKIWEIDTTFSMPHYFKEHSDSNHIILVDVYGRNGLNDPLCFVSSIPYESTGCDPYAGYIREILQMADPVINFGVYAKNNDTLVEEVFFVSMTTGWNSAAVAAWSVSHRTNDTNSQGDTVTVSLSRGICVDADSGWENPTDSFSVRPKTVRLAVHEYGHLLGLGHAFGSDNGECSALGPYHMMGLSPANFWPPVMGPQERLQLNWVTPIDITQSELDKPVRNYLRDNEVYRIEAVRRAFPEWGEYFWLTHYYGLNHPDAKFWEGGFNGNGLLIWHFDPNGNGTYCNNLYSHKEVDLELAHGLYIYDYTPPYDPPSLILQQGRTVWI